MIRNLQRKNEGLIIEIKDYLVDLSQYLSQIKEDDSKTTVSDPIIENLAVQQGRFSSVLDKILENKDDKLAIVFDKIISKEDGSSEIKSQTELPKLYIRKFNGKSFKCSSFHDNSHFAIGFHANSR